MTEPLTADDIMAMDQAAFADRIRATGMEAQVVAALARLPADR